MSKIASLLTLLVTAFVCLLPAAPAQAAAARTFVSAAGSDSNNCTNVATPCRHLATAYAATAANGEIYVLDPANYGSLTITGPVSIEGHGWASIAPVVNSAAITINAPGATDKINIIGVVLDGTALTGSTGIQFNSGGSLTVRDSVIRNFSGQGIAFETNASTPSNISVLNTLISDNGGIGIFIVPAGSGMTTGVIDHVQVDNLANSGIEVATTTATTNVTISDSLSTHGTNEGIVCPTGGSAPINIMVRNSTIANNAADGLFAGTNCTIRVTRSTITGNGFGWGFNGAGVVLSYGDNNIDGNGGANNEPPNPLVYH